MALEDELGRPHAENDRLKAILANSDEACIYCGLTFAEMFMCAGPRPPHDPLPHLGLCRAGDNYGDYIMTDRAALLALRERVRALDPNIALDGPSAYRGGGR